MSAPRFVVLGLGHPRADWFPEVARWSTSGHLPVEFLKCVSIEDLRARAAGGRRFSAALVDGRLAGVDRDFVARLADHDVATIVVRTTTDRTDWHHVGAAVVLEAPLVRDELHDALERHATAVAELTHDHHGAEDLEPDAGARGRMVAVTGRSGSGRSTVAIAVAQHLAGARRSEQVVLVDLARRAHQALLHDAGDLIPGIQELAEACRSRTLSARDLRPFTFDIDQRGYHVVLGLRRPRDWVTIRTRAFGTALDSIDRAFGLVVADVDDDLEGESETGSFDIEDRNLMARTAMARADVVVAVARPTLTGLHGLVDSLHGLRELGVEGARILVALNRAPRSPRSRAELTRALAELARVDDGEAAYAGAVFIAERRNLDLVHHDQARVPLAVADPPGRAVEVLLERNGPRRAPVDAVEPVLIQPGSLGTLSELDR